MKEWDCRTWINFETKHNPPDIFQGGKCISQDKKEKWPESFYYDPVTWEELTEEQLKAKGR